jgi:hypothetical protein
MAALKWIETVVWPHCLVPKLILLRRTQVSKLKSSFAKPKLIARCCCAISLLVRSPYLTFRRFVRLGFTEKHLHSTLRYIRNDVPLIIHVNLDRVYVVVSVLPVPVGPASLYRSLDGFLKDTHYRNQFETGTSGGALSFHARRVCLVSACSGCDVECRRGRIAFSTTCTTTASRLTGSRSGRGEECRCALSGVRLRVKYGVLNIVKDPNGVLSCSAYVSDMVLLSGSPSILGEGRFARFVNCARVPSAFACNVVLHADTSLSSVMLSSCEHYCHVL